MKYLLFLYLIIAMIIASCDNSYEVRRQRKINSKKNLSHYKSAMIETENLIEHKKELSANEVDSLVNNEKSRYPNLGLLSDNKLLVTQNGRVSIFIQPNSSFNFIIYESMGSFIEDLISDRKTYRYEFVSYDPQKTWLESKNTMGVINDAGFNEIESIGDDWYFVSGWSAE